MHPTSQLPRSSEQLQDEPPKTIPTTLPAWSTTGVPKSPPSENILRPADDTMVNSDVVFQVLSSMRTKMIIDQLTLCRSRHSPSLDHNRTNTVIGHSRHIHSRFVAWVELLVDVVPRESDVINVTMSESVFKPCRSTLISDQSDHVGFSWSAPLAFPSIPQHPARYKLSIFVMRSS
jgi:hypothetical protein